MKLFTGIVQGMKLFTGIVDRAINLPDGDGNGVVV